MRKSFVEPPQQKLLNSFFSYWTNVGSEDTVETHEVNEDGLEPIEDVLTVWSEIFLKLS